MMSWGVGRRRIPFVQQLGPSECGVACLAMVLRHFGRRVAQQELSRRLPTARDGATAKGIIELATAYGLRVTAVRATVDAIAELPRASILHWRAQHYVVLDRVHRAYCEILDPSDNRRRVSHEELGRLFSGVALVFEPSPDWREPDDGGPALEHWRHLSPIFGELGELTVVIGASALVQIASLALPLVTARIIDEVLPAGDHIAYAALLAVAGAAVVAATIGQLFRGWSGNAMRRRLDGVFGVRFISHLLALPFAFFEQRSAGDLTARINSNSVVREVVTSAAVSVVLDGAFVVLYVLLLGSVSSSIAIAAIVLAALDVALHAGTQRRRRELIGEKLRRAAASQSCQVEVLGATEALKGMGLEDRAVARWSALQADQLDAEHRLATLDTYVHSLRGALAVAGPMVLMGVGGLEVMHGRLSLGMLLAASSIAMGLLRPVSALLQELTRIQLLGSHLERVNDIFARDVEEPPDGRAIDVVGEIRLEHVGFRHGDGCDPALVDIDLRIPAGSCVAIVGPSGAGKTTLARIIAGLYRPTEGTVHYDGARSTEISVACLRRQVGYVPQNATLFGPTLRSEISLARPDATDDDIEAAARLAGIHDEIAAMRLRYATPVRDGSIGLSGGQRQRVALARALSAKPKILVLDEATSALDSAAERHVFAAIAGLSCTRVVVAHRSSTVRHAELIVVLDRGRIVEQGAPDELLTRGGTYARLMEDPASTSSHDGSSGESLALHPRSRQHG